MVAPMTARPAVSPLASLAGRSFVKELDHTAAELNGLIGLARQLGISNGEAKRYIDAYFARYPEIRGYMDSTKALVKAQGNGTVQFAIETKITPLRSDQTPPPERFAELLLAEVDAAGVAPRVQVQSFDWRTLRHVQRVRPGMPTCTPSAVANP